jgi:hypothetical protein
MLQIEQELMPDFDDKMTAVSKLYHIPYINGMPMIH